MRKINILVDNIPAMLWGEESSKLLVAVHGNMSHKEDAAITILSEEATALGYQVLSFDLPKHGDRKDEPVLCKAQSCVEDLKKIMVFAQLRAADISLFGCSIGAYFSLLAYNQNLLEKALFLSPVVNMKRIIDNMMMWFNVSEKRLEAEREIPTPMGETLYWDYYCYVKENPVVSWDTVTEILYGKEDNLCEFEIISSFAKEFHSGLELVENGEHFFHTPEQLTVFRQWLKVNL